MLEDPQHPQVPVSLTRLSVAAFLALALACTDSMAPTAEGTWGGTEASLILSDSGGTLSYPCATGTIATGWTLSSDGHLTGSGEHFSGGGPVPIGGTPPRPAHYVGRINRGLTMELTVILTDVSDTLGPFHLVRGGPAVQEICALVTRPH